MSKYNTILQEFNDEFLSNPRSHITTYQEKFDVPMDILSFVQSRLRFRVSNEEVIQKLLELNDIIKVLIFYGYD